MSFSQKTTFEPFVIADPDGNVAKCSYSHKCRLPYFRAYLSYFRPSYASVCFREHFGIVWGLV